ncbi:monocarboxylate transporter 10 isoform X1 [Linepithema humile]|uniref:monocarboxylate transporter 10 isoform X1 n=1 Tax=Linepithema humile TaxID=83485 RepID=UPI0006230F54|nr:PREDICTED: monocarboxylate transporter 10 isoform X1 [Linepithema humile]XP_012221890.1 PREDICTED: monocarboxylate transporter 10 isoform X1 [Linepithema humile]XP_012221891.1 PREDICTED: monocarboxylate transporter 10 isoform X1 [Linepithema humile]XP_012221892.1 PREDICTED: monocarboxylate transporter 10 isoform X1 [Linepithema humile]XP_012221893.1 PREDICTED: monocarboxylate transporter 10 isoform X1 [Linepithema humile]
MTTEEETGNTESFALENHADRTAADDAINLADTASEPPDGGLRAWMIMIGSFTINGVLFSIINTYSLIYSELQKRLTEAGETEVSSKAALVGSLTIGTTFFLSPVAGIMTDKFGIQMTTFVGGAIASTGLFLSSLLINRVELLYLTYGVMYGLGASLAYTPSLVILGHYFKKYLGLVNGIVTAGSSVFTTLIPFLMELLLRRLGLEGTLRSMAMLTAIIMACAILFKPIPLNLPQQDKPQPTRKSLRSRLKEFVNVSIWKKKRYVVWASSIPLAIFGYFVPYVHIGKFVDTTFKNADGKLPVMCIGITSGIGRLFFGYIADFPKVDRILLQQISFISIGILTMLLPFTKSFYVLLAISLGMGLFDGCFISLLGPIAFDICGRNGATQAIGFLLGMCSIPLTVGPPIAGLLYDHTGSYDLPFMLAGVPPIVGALTMFLIRCVKENRNESSSDSTENPPLTKTECQNGEMRSNGFLPRSVTELKKPTEQNPSLFQRHPVRAETELQECSVHYNCGREYDDYHRYSESVPLLREKRALQPSTSFYQRTAQSSMVLTF